MDKIETKEQLTRTIAQRDELLDTKKNVLLEIATLDGLVDNLNLKILDYYDRGGNDGPEE